MKIMIEMIAKKIAVTVGTLRNYERASKIK